MHDSCQENEIPNKSIQRIKESAPVITAAIGEEVSLLSDFRSFITYQ
uniref:Bm14113 n=1 Tax=Brugia malayi TaxID=6279 RepID=A0A1I9GC43_BRUMA|nr:Bm14113 [Brugia malayi]